MTRHALAYGRLPVVDDDAAVVSVVELEEVLKASVVVDGVTSSCRLNLRSANWYRSYSRVRFVANIALARDDTPVLRGPRFRCGSAKKLIFKLAKIFNMN